MASCAPTDSNEPHIVSLCIWLLRTLINHKQTSDSWFHGVLLLPTFSLSDVCMANWPSKYCPEAIIGVDFEVTLIQYQLCQLNPTGCNACLNWKKVIVHCFWKGLFKSKLILNLLWCLYGISRGYDKHYKLSGLKISCAWKRVQSVRSKVWNRSMGSLKVA